MPTLNGLSIPSPPYNTVVTNCPMPKPAVVDVSEPEARDRVAIRPSLLLKATDAVMNLPARVARHVRHCHPRGRFETLAELAYYTADEGKGAHFFGASYDSVRKIRALEKRYVLLSMAMPRGSRNPQDDS
jgi:hypothetical protein